MQSIWLYCDKGPSIHYVTRILWFFDPSPVLLTDGHISDTPLPSVTSHILQLHLLNSRRLTKFPHVYELARHGIVLSEHWMSLRVYWLSCSMCNVQCAMCNAFQWNCFKLVDACNIALILFLKCDAVKVTQKCIFYVIFADCKPF